MTADRLLDRIDATAVLADLAGREVNYRQDEVSTSTWRFDTIRREVARESPGEPEPDGAWAAACRLVAAYEQSDPEVVRAVYDPTQPLLGREMVLEGRFLLLRFYMGVRVTEVIDEARPAEDGGSAPDRVWGWAYDTLEGHLERGRMAYEVVKRTQTGAVDLVIRAYSQGAPTLDPVTTLGWKVFGRRTQLRFYAACGDRVAALVRRADRSVPMRRTDGRLELAPSDAHRRWPDRLAIRRHQPG